jgi:hypothetical protein
MVVPRFVPFASGSNLAESFGQQSGSATPWRGDGTGDPVQPKLGKAKRKLCNRWYQHLWFSICDDLDRVRKHVIKAEGQFGYLRLIGMPIRVCHAQSKPP